MTQNNIVIQPEEWRHIERAITNVQGMLLKKKDVWTAGTGPFHQFDAMEEMHITPEQFGLIMAQLKMNRVKTVFDRNRETPDYPDRFTDDPDAEDSLIDLASYALLTLGLIYRARSRQVEISVDEYGPCNDSQGQEQINKIVAALQGDEAQDVKFTTWEEKSFTCDEKPEEVEAETLFDKLQQTPEGQQILEDYVTKVNMETALADVQRQREEERWYYEHQRLMQSPQPLPYPLYSWPSRTTIGENT